MIFYTHVEHSPTKTIYIRYYMETHTHTHTHSLTIVFVNWEKKGKNVVHAAQRCTSYGFLFCNMGMHLCVFLWQTELIVKLAAGVLSLIHI